ncbi:hypothetical protein XANCAGTX0491_000985 [Xanthoria calcicola]
MNDLSSSTSSSTSDTSSKDEFYTAIRALKEVYNQRHLASDAASASNNDDDERGDEETTITSLPSLPPAPPSPTQHFLLKMRKHPATATRPRATAVSRDLETCRPLTLGHKSKGLDRRRDTRDESAVQDASKGQYPRRKRKKEPEDVRIACPVEARVSESRCSGVSSGRKRRRVGSS